MTTTPTLDRVEIETEDGRITVWPMWAGVDRAHGHGFGCTDLRIANRLKAAIEAGAVFYDVEVQTDINGATYVASRSRVLGRIMNADLRRLGF